MWAFVLTGNMKCYSLLEGNFIFPYLFSVLFDPLVLLKEICPKKEISCKTVYCSGFFIMPKRKKETQMSSHR
jgi:hypothetical protein